MKEAFGGEFRLFSLQHPMRRFSKSYKQVVNSTGFPQLARKSFFCLFLSFQTSDWHEYFEMNVFRASISTLSLCCSLENPINKPDPLK